MELKQRNLYLIASGLILLAVGLTLFDTIRQPTQNGHVESSVDQSSQPGEIACTNHDDQPWDFSESTLRLGDQQIPVAVADEGPEKQKGLSGCQGIPEGSGMLFVFDPAGIPTFWMKDTLIPLDIVWIADDQVIGVVENMQPEPGVADENLERYQPDSAVSAALELPAGTVDSLGLEVGQSAILEQN